MSISYEFSIGSVRAREKHLFSKAEIEQMISLGDEWALVSFLKDKGFGEGNDIDDIIESNKNKTWKYIKDIAPDYELFKPFILQNDVHNLKTILKGTMSGRSYDHLLIEPCVYKHDELISIVENRRFDKLPEWLGDAADKAYVLLAETKDARLSDSYIDKAVLDKLNEYGKQSKSVFLREYFRYAVFYANVKTALRGAKMNVGKLYLDNAVAECEGLDREKLIECAVKGSEELIKYLEKINCCECKKAIEAYKKSALAFEKFTDDIIMRLARKLCRLSSEGPEPLVGYFIGCEYERKLINMISSGLKTDTPPEKIRERLREIYG